MLMEGTNSMMLGERMYQATIRKREWIELRNLSLFEPMFYPSSYGYRPGKSCHTAIKALNKSVMYKLTNYVVEKAGIMEDGDYKASNEGVPQGGVVSPILANIYLRYVVDMWYETQIKSNIKNYTEIIRYCDDVVGLFECKSDVEKFLIELEVRFAKFEFKLSKDKTRIIKFGR